MRNIRKIVAGTGLAGVGAAALIMSGMSPISAADHFDPPQRTDEATTATADIPADIADLYLYHTSTSVIISLGFGGPRPANEPAKYDRDVLYNILVSNAGSKVDPEFNIEFRLGQDRTNPAASGIRLTGIPGATAPIIGPAETIINGPNGVKVFVGLIDDPFNFDAVGFRMTRESGALMFNNQRNRFTGLNTTAVVIEIPIGLIRNGDNRITAWAKSARIIPA